MISNRLHQSLLHLISCLGPLVPLTRTISFLAPPPPPLFCPTPCPSAVAGVGNRHLVNTKSFCHGSLCCCVGDCVVRHCHLYPLYSWQDILLTFAKMELDSTTMFTPGTNVMFIHSTGESGEHVQEFKVKCSKTKKIFTQPVN